MLTKCSECGCWIQTDYGAEPPAAHLDHSGTKDDPRAPGDTDDICDQCDYGGTD